MIEIRNIYAGYKKEKSVLNNISFKLEKGTLNSLVGPSGCGKTTMLKILAGFMQPYSGSILCGGKNITDTPVQNRGMAMVFQNYALWPHMSVFDNIAYGLKLKKTAKAEIQKRVDKMIRLVELDACDLNKIHPQELSGGQQQRVALARALVTEPEILLMDEPLSNLDAKVRQRLRIQIREIQKRLAVTIVYVTHDQEEALSMSDQVIVMNRGIVAQAGSPKEIYEHPQSEFVAEFLGNSNVIQCEKNSSAGSRFPFTAGTGKGDFSMIVRADNIYLEKPEDSDCMQLEGNVIGHMYAGTYYRSLIRIGDTEIFVDSDHETDAAGKVPVYIPRKNIFVFPCEKQRI